MGNWIVDITNFIRANSSTWSDAAFAFQLPEGAPDPSVVIAPPIEGLNYDRYLPDWYRGYFQAVATSHDIAAANAAGKEILRLLTMYDAQIGNTQIVRCTPDTIPIVYPKSESDLFETSVTMNITFIDTRTRTGS